VGEIICWWSGGITSAVACHLAIGFFGLENCKFIMIDTRNEDDDTYRFKKDCETWYGKEIETIHGFGNGYEKIEDVWRKHKSLNVAHGAVCSSELKRRTREKWQKANEYKYQVFGFEFGKKEFNRANGILLNHAKSKPIFPLLMMGLDKDDCMRYVRDAGIDIPRAYSLYDLNNNNCLKTFCPQGGLSYWAKIRDTPEFHDRFLKMAAMEHELTDSRGSQVTMLKDQSAEAKLKTETDKFSNLVFLLPHKDYPQNKSLADMNIPENSETILECNGFCGVNDLLPENETEKELNLFNYGD